MQHKRSNIQSWVKLEERKVFYDLFFNEQKFEEKVFRRAPAGLVASVLKNPTLSNATQVSANNYLPRYF